MNKKQVNDELLYRYMPALEEKLLHAMPETSGYEFSREFETKMERLLKKFRYKQKYGIPVTTWRRIAAVIMIVLFGAFAASMSVEAVREKVFEFIENMYETYVERQYFLREDMTEKFVPAYPVYIPEGYEVDGEELYENYLFIGYEEKNGNGSITICQEKIEDGMVISEDIEYVEEREITIKMVAGKIKYKANGVIRISWEKQGCIYMVTGKGVDEEELLRICESME